MTGEVSVELRAGQVARAAFGVEYIASDPGRATSLAAVEVLLTEGCSVLLSSGTDWTLEVSEGRWPVLPIWCWPVESWTFEEMPELGQPGLDRIISVSEIHDSVGELCGVDLEFSAAWVTVRSGEALTWSVSRRTS